MSDKQRTSIAHPLDWYTFTNYLAYIFYPPLYIAGPIITFNDFMWQVNHCHSHLTSKLTHISPDAQEKHTDMEFNNSIRNPVSRVFTNDGVHSPLHVHGGNQRRQSLGWVLCGSTQYGRLLEPDYRLA